MSVQLTVDSVQFDSIAEGDTETVNCQLSTVNYFLY